MGQHSKNVKFWRSYSKIQPSLENDLASVQIRDINSFYSQQDALIMNELETKHEQLLNWLDSKYESIRWIQKVNSAMI